jgi:hypothetical protein
VGHQERSSDKPADHQTSSRSLPRESGVIDEAEPALLKDALERDLSGDKIHSTHGDFSQDEWEIEREFQRWGEAEEASYFNELNAKAKAILDSEDIQYRPAS